MKDKNNAGLLKSLEHLPTPDLDAMLHLELESELPDEQAIQLILQVLRKREEDFPLLNNLQIDKAWDTYQKKTSQNSFIFKEPLMKVAVALVLCSLLLFVLPQAVQAENYLGRIATWTENVFEIFEKRNQGHTPKEYVFQTKHPGLQELYIIVTELGITTPVVPMYLDEGYILESCEQFVTPTHNKVIAKFTNNSNTAVYELNIYSDSVPREFQKDNLTVATHESNGVIHYLFQNNNTWTLVWIKDNIECTFSLECQKDEVYRIIDSIYAMEE